MLLFFFRYNNKKISKVKEKKVLFIIDVYSIFYDKKKI